MGLASVDLSQFRYTSFYSEENAYFMCQKLHEAGIAVPNDLFVVFLSNQSKHIQMWNHKTDRDGIALLDFHVFCVQRRKEETLEDLVWDLDSSLSIPSTISSYVSQNIQPSFKLFKEFKRVFRVVHAPLYLLHFASDRRHMEDSTSPPPNYDAIVAKDGTKHNLNEYIDMSAKDVPIDIDEESIDAVFHKKMGVLVGEDELVTFFSHLSRAYAAKFADAVVQIYLNNAGDLDSIANCIESAQQLDICRYGDIFFDVFLTGGCTQTTKPDFFIGFWTGGCTETTKPDDGKRHNYSVLDREANREAILPSVTFLQNILSGSPSLINNLVNVMRKLLESLESFDQNRNVKLAIFTALTFQPPSLLPLETVIQPLKDLVGKGRLTFITAFFKEYLIDNSIDDLISILKQCNLKGNLLEFFPFRNRCAKVVYNHFIKNNIEEMIPLVEYIFEVEVKEMKTAITKIISEETDISKVIDTVKQHVGELPLIMVLRILWDVLMDAVPWSGENQQNAKLAHDQVKTWAKLLITFCTRKKLKLELLYKVQVRCYEDTKLTKLFPKFVMLLYDYNVLDEVTICDWESSGTNPKGRESFVRALAPFVKWLKEAEEETSEDE